MVFRENKTFRKEFKGEGIMPKGRRGGRNREFAYTTKRIESVTRTKNDILNSIDHKLAWIIVLLIFIIIEMAVIGSNFV